MKNYLLSLLLIISIATQAQTYQNPTFGKLTLKTNTLSTSTAKISTQETDGQINYIPATSLPVPTSVVNALDLKVENSAGAIEGFAITNNGDGTVNIATGTAYLRQANNPYAPLIKYVIPAVTNLSLTDNANNFVLVDYNAGSPALTVTIATGTINTMTNSIAYLISRVGTTLDYINLVGQNIDANGKLRRRFLNSESLRRAQGAVLTSSNRNLLVTAGLFYSGLIEVSTPSFNTSTVSTFTQVYINGTWTRSTGNTQINNTQYSLAGVLTAMPTNDYRVDYVYVLADNPSKLYVLLGTTTYNNISSARLSPVPVDLPSELQYLGTRIGRVIIQKNATTMETSSEYATIYQAGTATLHNDLGGLNLGDFQHLTVAEKANNELITNKQNSLAVDGTGIKYPTVDATNAGLATKQNTLTNPITGTGTINTFPLFTGTTTQGNSILTQTTTTSVNVNGNIVAGTASPTANVRAFFEASQVNVPTLELKNPVSSTGFAYAGLRFTPNFGSVQLGKLNSNSTGYKPLKAGDTFLLNNANGNIAIFNDRLGVGNINFTVNAMSTPAMTLESTGNLIVNTTIDNGQGVIQANGNITASPATLSNQVVVKSQLDLKANIDSQTFTGVPSVPTATAGTNTTQIASTAYVYNAFTGGSFGYSLERTNANLLEHNITNNSTTTVSVENNNSTGLFRQTNNNSTGTHNRFRNESTGTGNLNLNILGGTFNGNQNQSSGLFNGNFNLSTGIFNENTNSNTGIFSDSYNTSTGTFDKRRNDSTGILNYYNSATLSTGDLQQYLKNGVVTSKINHLGELTVPKITNTGVQEYADNAAAITAGLSIGTHYRTGDLLKIVH